MHPCIRPLSCSPTIRARVPCHTLLLPSCLENRLQAPSSSDIVHLTQRRYKSSNRPPRRPASIAPEIIIPPTFSDGLIPKAQLRLTREEAAARAGRLADPSIVDQLRAEGRISRAHWRFNHDPARATPRYIRKGSSLLDAYKMTSPRYWLSIPKHIKGKFMGTLRSWSAYWSKDVIKFLSVDGGVVDMLQRTVKPALEALSYSPNDHARWQSASIRNMFTPTLYARLSACTSILRTHGDLQFKLSISDVQGLDQLYHIRRRLLISDSRLQSSSFDLLGPRVVIIQRGKTEYVANLEHDIDSVPSWQQLAYLKDYASDQLYGQLLIDVTVSISGTATIERVPPPPPTPARPGHPFAGSKRKSAKPTQASPSPNLSLFDASSGMVQGLRVEEDRVVFQESFTNRRIVMRMASTPFKLVRDTNRDYPIDVNAPWRVADIDYLTSSLLVERSKKLAPYLASLW
ncbi:hypothetical protein BCR44DRAFT_34118 [Catenaria anguillulae PL171]|uniref:Uncharacterized protein n=1 Tax=Catenaria anguillulae PL171 TaxID=765915 RepID=A0A1Y2HUY0_9FUNG|nr:hypothetical protein BCR44DRAFT_34118 [Catenaria anguillulae PL171]